MEDLGKYGLGHALLMRGSKPLIKTSPSAVSLGGQKDNLFEKRKDVYRWTYNSILRDMCFGDYSVLEDFQKSGIFALLEPFYDRPSNQSAHVVFRCIL